MVIFYSYVRLPEGSYETLQFLEHSSQTHRGSRTESQSQKWCPHDFMDGDARRRVYEWDSSEGLFPTLIHDRYHEYIYIYICIYTCIYIYISWIAQSWINSWMYCIMSAYSFLPACFYRSMCINFLPTHLPKDHFSSRSQDGTSFSPGILCILCILLFAWWSWLITGDS